MPNDIAFKVIIKNDGISDIIFKTLMLKGEAGGSISSIEKTSSVGVVDTYTITLNDGNTSTFEVTNGSNIESIEKTATSGLIDTYTVTLTNGDTTTFEVKNGEDAQLYELPEDCIVAYDKEPELHSITGQNGYVAFDAYGIKNVKVTGYTKQATTTGKNLFNILPYSSWLSVGSYILEKNILPDNTNLIMSFTDKDTSIDISGIYFGFCDNSYSGGYLSNYKWCIQNGNIMSDTTNIVNNLQVSAIVLYPTTEETYNKLFARYNIQIEAGSSATSFEPYTGGKPSPSPDFPQDIIGYGTKEQDGTYTIDIEVTDNDDNVYNITASGLAYPLYDGDVLDFENSKVIRANGCVDMGTLNYTKYSVSNGNAFVVSLPNGKQIQNSYNTGIKCTAYSEDTSVNNAYYIRDISCKYGGSYFGTTKFTAVDSNYSDATAFKTANDGNYIVYPLESPTDENVTISGDTSIVENLRGWTQVDAWDEDVTLDVWYYSDVEFPDGYEEVGLPIDDLLYYQDQEYIEFPTNWGFAMGYVFDANEVRFFINVTKDLHDGFRIVANKSENLALTIYTGSGGSGLTGFNFVDASFIREYGQIQLRLQTETAHGLTSLSLLGARVSQGRLRITFEAPE